MLGNCRIAAVTRVELRLLSCPEAGAALDSGHYSEKLMKGRVVQFVLQAMDRIGAALHKSRKAETAQPNRRPEHLLKGRQGEDYAYFFLRRHGYTVVARNFRCARRKGEVDLIAWDGDVLCFIEVKTRSTHDVKPAEAAVDGNKRRELRAMVREYRRRIPYGRLRCDIVTVYCDQPSAPPQITLFKNAFPVS